MPLKTYLLALAACVSLTACDSAKPGDPQGGGAESTKAESPIKPGMKVKVMYAASLYPGTLVRVDGAKYIVKDDRTGNESTYTLDRMHDGQGTPFAELLQTPEVRAAAAQDKKSGNEFFFGQWTTSSQGVWNTVDSKNNTDGSVTEKKRFEGTGSGGWLRINTDGTWQHHMFGKDMAGTWKASEDKDRPGLVLIKGNILEDDLYTQRRPKGQLFLQRAGGGAGHYATIALPGTAGKK